MTRSLLILACLICVSSLCGCEKRTVAVNVHGVNYTDNAFTYVVVDPENPAGSAGDGLIDPFAAGGTTCCAKLPRKWQPGIKLQVRTTHYLQQRPAETVVESRKLHIVEVPKYIDGTPGELWVLMNADGSVSVVSSDLQPDHAQWPGKIKGWPAPSIEYQRERWELYRKHEEGGVNLYLSLLEELKKEPGKHLKESWDHTKKRYPSDLVDFSGPNDPRYVAFLKKEYDEGLDRSRRLLKNVMEAKP
ncbi:MULTISPECIES: DUF3304 domain-containing protein [unclassified Massilia]|uniref:DUF3304 domain-containing protein n=1 Tax=unclassified Massilia TaxID=2609279 RepID=UPI001783B5A0|nr:MULTISPECIES: DUF3304 domain-containing protein [unclassified Massilia]MBD8528682.1 DUF3304 domain-containing protein [Massilia sp. CFBP 13647]MBD8672286.1 DUF3304 domain-containing protein [Massilia sp. CFBP 13721]